MLYNNWNNTRMIFEACYQIVIMTTFIGKLFCENWNSDKVCSKRNTGSSDFTPIFSIRFDYFVITWSYRRQIRCLYESMERHWNIFASEYEVQVLKRYASISRKLAIIYSGEFNAQIF